MLSLNIKKQIWLDYVKILGKCESPNILLSDFIKLFILNNYL